MAKKLEQFTSCVPDKAAIFSIAMHSNRFVCPPTWRRMTRDLLVQMAYWKSFCSIFLWLLSPLWTVRDGYQIWWPPYVTTWRPYQKSAIFVPCSSFSCFVCHCLPYVLIILLETGEKTLVFACAQDRGQQAMMGVKFWAEKFQDGWIPTFEVCFSTLPSSLRQ